MRPGVALAPGAQRTVTLQVAVSGDAPDRLQPLVRVSGGGEIDPSNDFFAVPTNVGGR